MTSWRQVIAAFCVLNAAGAVLATAASAETLEAAIPQWVQQLDADEYSRRKEAAARLAEAGIAALPALRDAARNADREVSARALEIIKRHFGGGDARLKQAAKTTLEELAKSDEKRVAAAAQQILQPAVGMPVRGPVNAAQVALAAARARAQMNRQPNLPRIAIQRAAIPPLPINARPVNGAQVVTVTQGNGERRMNVREPNRRVQIIVDVRGAIEVEVTTTKEGKAETKWVSAKDEAELKQKHPDEHKVFEEFKPRFGVQIVPFNAPPAAPNVVPPLMPRIPGVPPIPQLPPAAPAG